MRLNKLVFLVLPLAAAFAAVPATCFASTINGSVYENQPAFPASLTTPTSTANATFKVTGLMFDTGENGFAYTIGGFLNSYGDLVTGSVTNTSAGFSLNDTMNNTTFIFTGASYFVHGTTYSVLHDDGAVLTIGGTNYINSRSPTAADTSSFVYNGATGVQSFNLMYAEVNGAPGVLEAAIAPPPEPSSLLLLGTGLASIGGVIRRRMKA